MSNSEDKQRRPVGSVGRGGSRDLVAPPSPGKRTIVEAVNTESLQLQRKPADATASGVDGQQAGATATDGSQVLADDTVPRTDSQIAKRDFLAMLKPELEVAAAAELGPQWSTTGCPYINYYLQVYTGRSARDCEAFIRKFTGSKATTAQGLLADTVARVRDGVRSWRTTGQVPPEVAAIAAAQGAPVAPSIPPPGFRGSPSDGPAIQRKAAGQPAQATDSPAEVLDQLGEGSALDSSTQNRMGSAFGANFADVRVHADGKGNALAGQQRAYAFTVGSHVAFAAGRYAPGTRVPQMIVMKVGVRSAGGAVSRRLEA